MTTQTENIPKDIIGDLKFLLSLTKEEIQDIVNIFLEFTKRTSEISLDRIMDRLTKVNKIEQDGALRVARFVGWLGRVCSEDEKTAAFIENIKSLLESEESVKQVEAFLKQLSKKGIINGIFKFYKQFELEGLGLPRFVSLDIGTDYKMFTDLQGEKKIIPMVLFTIIINKLPIGQTDQIAFQTSLEDLRNIIKDLNEFSDNMQKDIDFLRNKSLSLVE